MTSTTIRGEEDLITFDAKGMGNLRDSSDDHTSDLASFHQFWRSSSSNHFMSFFKFHFTVYSLLREEEEENKIIT